MSADERAVELAAAVEAAGGAFPLPAGPEPSELEHLRRERDAFRDQRNAVFVTNERLLAEVQESDQARLLAENETRTVRREVDRLTARVAELEAERERRRVRLVALQNDALSMRGSLSPMGEDRKVPFPLGETLTPAVDWLIARVAELEAEKKRAAAHTEHVANCLVARTEELLESEKRALPWAHAMSDGDLREFLGDLASAALGRWRSEPEVPDRVVLADIEKVCADWRTPGQGLRSDEPAAPGPDERPVNGFTAVFVPVASLREPEGEFYPFLHKGRIPHDMPQTGGAQ